MSAGTSVPLRTPDGWTLTPPPDRDTTDVDPIALLLQAAAEGARAACHDRRPPRWPSDLATRAAELSALLRCVDTLLGMLERSADQVGERTDLYSTGEDSGPADAGAAALYLQEAGAQLDRILRDVDKAHQHLSRIGVR